MLPKRPQLRVGLSRRSIASSSRGARLTSAPRTAAPRPPLQPLHNQTTPRPAHTITKSDTTPKESASKKSKHYFVVLYTKNTRKKHKSWLDGYVVVADDRYVALHNDDGKHMLSERVPKLGGLVEGNTLEIRSWLIEVQNPISEDDFVSGRVFLKNAVMEHSAPRPRQQRAFKPLHPRGMRRSPAPAGPLHDPTAKDAVVLADGNIPVVLDPCLARRMRPHQVSGVKFLFGCVKPGGGAILADDMGLGKSLQAIALIWTLLRQGASPGPLVTKAIIVCPASLVTNWMNEVKKWLGDERLRPVAVASGNSTFECKQALAAFVNGSVKKVLIVSYEMFRSNAEDLYHADVGLLICDEGHRLKSSQGNKTIEALRKLPCRRRVILTGTPVQNDLEEFFAVCDFVNPGCLNTLQSFRSVFASPIIASRDSNAVSSVVRLGQARAKELGKVTSKFVLRRASNILERYLPMKLETAIFCKLQPNQEQAYEQEARCRYADIDTKRFSAALSAINYLRKICSHPVLAKSREDVDDECDSEEEPNLRNDSAQDKKDRLQDFDVNASSKMQIAVSICEASLAVGDRVIFVSNFTSTLDLVQKALVQRKITYCRLDGSTPVTRRGDIVRRFNKGNLGDIFLLSAKAGGVGLNLIGANRLILFDPDWNPAIDLQAMARIWRDGQKKHVFVYRLLSTGTIEEKIYQRQLFKGELQIALKADGGAADMQNVNTEGVLVGKEGNFSAEQLRDLFQYRGRLDFCETLQVLQRSQVDADLKSGSELEDDFEGDHVKQGSMLKRFSQYKERFQAENGVKDFIFCDEDAVLDNALNGDLKTHGLVSYLYTQKSGSAKDAGNKYQPPKIEKKDDKKRQESRHNDEIVKDIKGQPAQRKKRKLEPMFSGDSDSETDCESDPELAVLQAMAKSASKQRFKRAASKADETLETKANSNVDVHFEAPKSTEKSLSTECEMQMESIVDGSENMVDAAAESEKTWEEAVKALEVDDISAFV